MDFAKILRRRRMVRSYRPDPVTSEQLERIVGAVRHAPSAGFCQAHRLFVVTKKETRRAIAKLSNEEKYFVKPWLSNAAAHIVIGFREGDYHDRYQKPDKLQEDGTEIPWPVPFWYVDAGGLAMLIQLAAINEGLGAAFVGPTDWGPYRELLEIPDDVTTIGIVLIGHADPDEPKHMNTDTLKQQRRPTEDLVRWD
ncbi:nitroreductase family protein [Amycolatopsis nigrescens]|uniref:nitroreductase family protein n=1 Tax=Amycolatopsis nigrescens TaxID=381445 RepID=UPI000378B0EE|nr:nitroreductase family protein [Amycolatopsis nigrescens]